MLTLTSPPAWTAQETDALAWTVTQMSQHWSSNPNAPSQIDPLRWLPHFASDEPSFTGSTSIQNQLKLYYGASSSLFQTPTYRMIAHAQMTVLLGDDGLFEWPSDLLNFPLSSHWIYLERNQIGWADLGVHALQTQVGTRIERRLNLGEPYDDLDLLSQTFTLITPSLENPYIQPEEGLDVQWSQGSSPWGELGQSPLISLIFKDQQRTDLIICQIEEPSNRLILPSEAFSFWPTGPQKIRQITLQNTFKNIQLTAPDQGQLVQGVSLVMQLQTSEE
jgi:hypothetical protein